MPDAAKLAEKFWKAIKSDRTVMLGLAGSGEGMSQPMTALLDKDAETGPIYIFTARDTDLVQALGGRHPAVLNFASKGHDIFAAVEGELVAENDRATIDRLWSPFVAAWFEGGQDDPNLQLLRFEPGRGQIWENDNSLFAGARLLLGRDPKEDYQDKTAHLRLS
jgi:general stress protein 26